MKRAHIRIKTEDGTPGTSKVYVVVDGKEYELDGVVSIDWSVSTNDPADTGTATIKFLIWGGYTEEAE